MHGDKIAYSKIAIGLLDSLNRTLPDSDLRHNLQSRKRSLDASPDLLSRREDSIPRRFSEHATAAAAVTAEAPTAPTGSLTATTPTSPTGTIHSAASNPTGIPQHSPHTLARAANLAVLGGVAAAAASTTERLRAAVWPGKRK